MKFLWKDRIFNANVAQNATVYTSGVPFSRATGEVALLIVSSAGEITVTQQCSFDGENFHDPLDGAGSALGAVTAGMTVGTKYVVPSPVVAPYVRYKIVEANTAATDVSITLVSQEEE